MDVFIEKGKAYEDTTDAQRIVGHRVLCKSGEILGRVKQVRLDPDKQVIEGILVKSVPLIGRSIYINTTYIARFTPDAVLLKIDPASTYIGRPVVSADGKKFGKALRVNRVKQTNDIIGFEVRRHLFKKISIDADEFKKLGNSLILKKTYDKAKRAYTE